MRAGLVVAVVGLFVLVGGAVAVMLFRGGGGGTFEPSAPGPLMAAVGPRFADVEAVAVATVPRCAAHRGVVVPDEPSPAIGTPLATWPETRGVRVSCMFETVPGSGNASGGGFQTFGDDSQPSGSWSAWGSDGWSWSRCHGSGEECSEVTRSHTDPAFVELRTIRRFPSDDGWVEVVAVLHL